MRRLFTALGGAALLACSGGSEPDDRGNALLDLQGTYDVRLISTYRYAAQPCVIGTDDPPRCLTDTFAIAITEGLITLGTPGPILQDDEGGILRSTFPVNFDLTSTAYEHDQCTSGPVTCWLEFGEPTPLQVEPSTITEAFVRPDGFLSFSAQIVLTGGPLLVNRADLHFRSQVGSPLVFYDSITAGVTDIRRAN